MNAPTAASEGLAIAEALAAVAARSPHRPALINPVARRQGRACYQQWSYQQLDQLVSGYAGAMAALGIAPGDRTLVLIKPGIHFIATLFALFRLNAVPILIDPGMGRAAFLQCVAETSPVAMVAIPLAHLLRRLFPAPFRTLKVATTPTAVAKAAALQPPLAASRALGRDDEAAIFFTSGSTGIPKGVVYTNAMMSTQIQLLRQQLAVGDGEIHLAAFYAFALFNPALGATTLVPEMDPRHPAKVEPARLVTAIETFGATLSMGSPTLWRRVADYCEQERLVLPSLKQLMLFGAPIYPELVARLKAIFVNGEISTPYGATEALPVTQINHGELLALAAKTAAGEGVCVGRPVGEIQVRIIAQGEQPIAHIDDTITLKTGEIGEIIVKGPIVSPSYLNRPQKTALAKIADQGGVWHRMGDLGYRDESGRLWFCGRQSHRVETPQGQLLPVCCEAIFNAHPEVIRSALVGVGQRPVIVVESAQRSAQGRRRLSAALRELAKAHPPTQAIDTFLFYPGSFPVDVRHNAKILREQLAQWAAKRLGGQP